MIQQTHQYQTNIRIFRKFFAKASLYQQYWRGIQDTLNIKGKFCPGFHDFSQFSCPGFHEKQQNSLPVHCIVLH